MLWVSSKAKSPEFQDGQVVFLFNDPKGEITEEIAKYFNRDTQIDALTHIELIHNLNSQVATLRRNALVGGVENE